MIKRIPVLIALLLWAGFIAAQSDPINWVNHPRQSKKIAKGVTWTQIVFTQNDLFNANQYLNVIEITKKGRRSRLHIVRSDSLEKTSQIAQSNSALAAVNGSFFRMRGPDPDYRKDLNGVPKLERSKLDRNRSVVYFRQNDTLISENIADKDSIRKRNQAGSIVINNGKLSIVNEDPKSLIAEHRLEGEDVISTGPVLILSGVDQPIPNDAFCNDRHPRTAIGKKADGTVVLLVVDGRAKESAGFSIPELQKVMQLLRCVDAINLDGGGSTTMYIKDQPFNGVVNYPSDNKKFDHEGEREVANAILLIKK
jgi:exopolysaccharide biosynthesis protein